MRLAATLLLAIIFLLGCNPTRHSREYDYRENYDPKGKHFINLSDYQLYIREIYKDSTERDKVRSSKFPIKTFADPVAQNYSLGEFSENVPSHKQRLIEIEYLLYNKNSGKVVYITTVPDVNQLYYQEERKQHPRNAINVYNFNTFHLGKVTRNSKLDETYISMKGLDKTTHYKWEFKMQDDTIHILRIMELYNTIYKDERSIENSVRNEAKFAFVGDFQIIFHSPKVDAIEMESPAAMHFLNKKKKYCVYFKFKAIGSKNGSNQKSVPKEGLTTLLFKKAKQVQVDPSIIWEDSP